LGWDNFQSTNKIEVKGITYNISGVARKKDFCVLECTAENGQIPEAAVRHQFENPVSKLYHDHLLVFTGKSKTTQRWQMPLRED
jgi:hypothetical protein